MIKQMQNHQHDDIKDKEKKYYKKYKLGKLDMYCQSINMSIKFENIVLNSVLIKVEKGIRPV